jgi:5-methylcytosine-specific restriction endonuclease McrA
MNNCKNLLKRQRKYKPYFYCKALRKEIILPCDKNCSNRNLVRNKGIKKVSKKRIFIKPEIYEQVYNRDKGQCQLCGSNNIQLHHIVYRSENKKLINEPSNCIMLCAKCHELVHSNKHYWQPKLKEIIGGL